MIWGPESGEEPIAQARPRVRMEFEKEAKLPGGVARQETKRGHLPVESKWGPDVVQTVRPVSGEVRSSARERTVADGPRVEVSSSDRPAWPAPAQSSQPDVRSATYDKSPKPPVDEARSAQPLRADSSRPTLGELSAQTFRRTDPVSPVGERPPVVHIRIGRIEVRAVEQAVPASRKRVVESPRSSLPLDQYLRRGSRNA